MAKRKDKEMAKVVGRSLSNTKNGFSVGTTRQKGTMPAMINYFGCLKCPHAGTKHCPHGITGGGHHANWICNDRVMYLKKRYEQAGSVPKIFQQETLFGLSNIFDNMLKTYHDEGELPDDFRHIAKLVVSLTDKMRKQDEGIKIQGEITHSHKHFKELVDIEARKIEERDNKTRPAEFTEEIRDN